MKRRIRFELVTVAAVVLLFGRCASAPSPAPRDSFPLDPREGLPGPFDESIADGWRALRAGDPALAQREFGRSRGSSSVRAAEIGTIEALVAARRSPDALAACEGALEQGEPTAPLLVACGEARARAGEPVGAYELYQRAAAGSPERPGLLVRAEKLRAEATETLLVQASRDAAGGRFAAARAAVARAIEWNPRSPQVLVHAAEVECAAGEKEHALQFGREAMALGGLGESDREAIGDLAMETGDYALAVSVFEGLASEDPRFGERAAQARLAFRVANWPEAERQAARARRLTRAGAATLVWWTFPEVREARVTGGVVASDLLDRKDSRPAVRMVSLGLLDVDPETHRARPDAALTRAAAAQMMLRLCGLLRGPGGGPACLEGSPGPWRGAADAIRLAARCGLLAESGGPFVSGQELTRGLDVLRSLLPTEEGQQP